ncbi:D-alanyl-lipoteichoic acid biosynthesis protein DltB, partial [Holdemanella sp. DFI.5.21]|nr:D-alanyl-lipoteichoic acid biosynthesis protein DltB [Holdemanella sp. DFI.5.21]
TISSGPIDRYRRFVKDYDKAPSRDDYIKDLSYAVRYLFQGFLYKFLLGWFFGTYCLPYLEQQAILAGRMYPLHLSWWLLGVMYCYSM